MSIEFYINDDKSEAEVVENGSRVGYLSNRNERGEYKFLPDQNTDFSAKSLREIAKKIRELN